MPIFYLHIQSRGCTGGIWLNDAPMFAVDREHEQRALPTISEWVVDGENALTAQLSELGEDPRIRVALCQARLGDVPEPGQEIELIVIEWPPIPVPAVEGLAIEPEPPGLPLVSSEVGPAAHPWGGGHGRRRRPSPPTLTSSSCLSRICWALKNSQSSRMKRSRNSKLAWECDDPVGFTELTPHALSRLCVACCLP